MDEKIALVCETCLSSDRRLVATSRIIQILRGIRCEELSNKVICWECRATIMNFYMFKMQVKRAQHAFCEKILDNFKSLSRLSHSAKYSYDFEFMCNSVTNEPDKEEIESRIKYEVDHSTEEQYNQIDCQDYKQNDTKLTIFAESLESSKEKKSPKKRPLSKQTSDKKKKSSSQKVKDIDLAKEKFETILLTEEEMLRIREEKRNHPNYKKIPYKCDTCVLGFIKKDNFDLHFAKKHDETIGGHVCDVCATRFATSLSLSRHRARHSVQYACSLCPYKGPAATAATNHCRDQHATDDRDSIHCKQCTAVFSSAAELSEHTRTDHGLYCKDCGQKFKGKHTLRAHRTRIHAVKREFTCDICKKSFLTKSRLESHLTTHSPTLARRLAYCAVCDVQYKNIQVYRSHLQNNANHALNRYQCPECGKRFASKAYRTKHYKFYHLRASRYKCHACNKLFISEWRLKNHRQKHHGAPRSRDHECTHCGNKFYTSSALSAHAARHSRARRHLCARCGARYNQPAALYAHEKRAHAHANTLSDNKALP